MAIVTYWPRGVGERVGAMLLRLTLQCLLRPVLTDKWSFRVQRAWLRVLGGLSPPLRGVRFEPASVAGVPGEWAYPSEASTASGVLLYLHGGGYCVGSPRTHRAITGHLARFTGRPIFVPDYRLAPKHPFPAALDDTLACLNALTAVHRRVVVAGDSAGGGLALAATVLARDRGCVLPVGLWLLSPWVDQDVGDRVAPVGEAMLGAAWGRACSAAYCADTPLQHPLCSPLHADLHGLPPVRLQVGTDELLHGDTLRLHDALQAAGVPVVCEIEQRRWHVWQLHAGVLPSATAAVRRGATFACEALDGRGTSDTSSSGISRPHAVVVLGAGMSGLCAAIQLKRAGIHDFVVLEKSAGLGGTWWDNRYPGAHVDVPAPLYSFSFAPNRRWRRRFAAAAEIQAYMGHCADRFGVAPHLRFGCAVVAAEWDEGQALWRLRTSTGEPIEARWFICSTGPLSQACWPEIPGLADFSGQRLHSAQWDPAVQMAGRRVGVIGTGSTASQLVPPVAEAAARLTVFQRTANWVLPRMDRRYGMLDHAVAQFPPAASLARRYWYWVCEGLRSGFNEGTMARRVMHGLAHRHLAHVSDPILRERLTPRYPLGCKRIIYSNDFYPALARSNVELVTTAIERVVPEGLVTADGHRHRLDVLVCATGFDTTHLLKSIDLRGRDGRALAQAWTAGPAAYRGVTVPDFPNLFLTLGPNTATGHTSTLLYIEAQVQFAIAAIVRTAATGHRPIFEVRREAFEAHNAGLQARLNGSVWTACRSWYRMEGGRITALWPGFTAEYVRGLSRPDWRDYRIG